MTLLIRPESPVDADAIAALTTRAFAGAAHSGGNEAAIIAGLRADGALMLSLIADGGAGVIGHAAFSPIRIDGLDSGWSGLGPVSVAPERQGNGIGAALIRAGLDMLRAQGAAGCVVLGDPGYYSRFGFAPDAGLVLPGMPAAYFMALPLAGPPARGVVSYHSAFGA
ncbi:MAG: N-acetyltransferase [Paracoccus sp. (in: a-proteobacteria)]|nr:N-acetyltransferase [Paracoccus sp. (in: a-proteobacteria)]